jgi:hypothetical protein
MSLNRILGKTAAVLLAGLVAIALSIGASVAASTADSEFVGTWKVSDSEGKPMEIVLAGDGTAKGTRENEGLTGKWKAGKRSAVISWDSGWTTKIVKKDENKFRKHAYAKGMEPKGKPTNSSAAEKVQ